MMTIDKKLIPALRFPQFSGEWEVKRLGDIAEIITGTTPSTSNKSFYDGDILFISPGDIKGNKFIDVTETRLTDMGFERCRHIPQNAVVFVCVGSTIGKLAMTKIACATNQQINSVISTDLFPDFMYYSLAKVARRIKYIAPVQALPIINKSEFSKTKLNLPTLPEQEKIASFLSSIDRKVELLKAKKEQLEQYKKGMMQQLFAQTIRFKDQNGKQFPEWQQKRLGEVLDYLQPTKYLVSSTEYSDIQNLEYPTPVLTAGKSFILGYSNEDHGIFEQELLPVIIFDDFTTSTQFVTKPFKVKSSAMKILISKPNYNIKLVYELMQMIRYQVGGHGRHWISIYSKLKINLPSLPEQQKIADFLSAIDRKIEGVGQQMAQTELFKKAMLQQLFV